MRLELDDPRLMDYVLGELEDGEALSLAAALEREENKAARELVEELRGVTEMTRRILHEEDGEMALSDKQRAAIVGAVAEVAPINVNPFRKRVLAVLAGVAAVLLMGFLASMLVPTYGGDYANKLASRLEPAVQNAPLPEAISHDALYIEPEHRMPQSAQVKSARSGMETHDRVQTYSEEPRKLNEGQSAAGSPPPSGGSGDDGIRNVEVAGSVRMRGDWAGSDGTPPEDPTFVEQRTRLGVNADFTDEVSPYIEIDAYDNWGDAQEKKAQTAPGSGEDTDLYQSKIELKNQVREGIVADGALAMGQSELNRDFHAKDEWDDVKVGNLSGQAGNPVAPPAQETKVEFGIVTPPNSTSWQWYSPESKTTEIVGGPGSETYVKVAEMKPFVAVKDEPLSTFSIDVDTAAYSNVRRFLSQGQLPPADAVRIEEMINYFAYSYPQPTDGRPFAVAVHGAPAPWAPERQLVRIGVKGKEVPASERPPANLVFLLDVSGSMGDANKLPLVKESMKTLLRQLRPNDRVGIVTYAGDARLVLGSTPCSEGAAITQAIESLQSGGSTNGGGGIQMAYDLAQSNFIKEGINRVVMATDGDFNVGTTEHGDLMGMIEARAKSGVFLTTLGFGMGNLKDSTLEQLADRGNGNYAYIDNHAEARKALVDQLSGTLQTIAKDVKIQVEFNPAKVSHYRLLGYENRALAAQDFNDDTKDAGEIGAGHTVTALYEIIPVGVRPMTGVDALKYQSTTPGGIVVPSDVVAPSVDPLKYQGGVAPQASASPEQVKGEERIAPEPMPLPAGEWLTVKMRYKQPEGNESTKIDVPLMAMNGDLREADPDFRFASAVAAFGQVLRNSGYRHPSNFDRIIELARGAANGDTDREAFVDLVITAKTLSAQNR